MAQGRGVWHKVEGGAQGRGCGTRKRGVVQGRGGVAQGRGSVAQGRGCVTQGEWVDSTHIVHTAMCSAIAAYTYTVQACMLHFTRHWHSKYPMNVW